jgi:threonine dehydrogenase-like Zn-dependent dehydrogenase
MVFHESKKRVKNEGVMVRAAVMYGDGRAVEIQDIAEPELEENSGLMDVELSEICGTDVHLLHSRLSGVPYPIIPGHVSVGRLSRIRGSLRDIHGELLVEGDRITFLDVHETCHACWSCLVGKASTRCPKRKVYGITYGLADGLTGGWAEKLYIKPGVRCIKLGDMPFEHFMAGGCALPTALHAIDQGAIRIGESVLVLGSGPVGLSAVAFARMSGASQVLCIGGPGPRLSIARQMGATDTSDIFVLSEKERLEWVRERTSNRGVDVTIEAAGAPVAAIQACRFTREAGRVVIVGQYTDNGEVAVNPHLDINRKHLDIKGCWGSDFSHFYRAVQVMSGEEASKPWKALTSKRFSLENANEGLAAVAKGQLGKALIDPRI